MEGRLVWLGSVPRMRLGVVVLGCCRYGTVCTGRLDTGFG